MLIIIRFARTKRDVDTSFVSLFFCWAAGECFENGESKLSFDFEILFSKRSTLSLNTSFLQTWDFHTISHFLPMTRSTLRPGNDVSTEN